MTIAARMAAAAWCFTSLSLVLRRPEHGLEEADEPARHPDDRPEQREPGRAVELPVEPDAEPGEHSHRGDEARRRREVRRGFPVPLRQVRELLVLGPALSVARTRHVNLRRTLRNADSPGFSGASGWRRGAPV